MRVLIYSCYINNIILISKIKFLYYNPDMDILDEINNLIAENEFEKAKHKLLQTIAENGETIEETKLLGLVNVNLNCYEEAKQNFEKVVTEEQEDATSWFYLGNCYDKLHDLERAKAAYINVIELRENYLDAYKSLCIILMQLKEEDVAIEYAKKAHSIDNSDYTYNYLIGTAYVAKKEYEKAIEYLQQAIKINPNHSQIYNNLATTYLMINKQDDAIITYKKALEIDSENPDTLYNLGSLYQIQNNHIEACQCFEKSYSISNNEKSLIALTLSEFKGGNFPKAIEHYKTLVLAHPEKDSYQYNLALCYEQIHDYQAAISILKQLTTRNPKSLTMVQKLAGLYMEIRDLRSAKELYDKVILKNSPTASTLYQYAIISSQLYDTDTAERIFKKVIGMNPDNALAHKDLGVIYLNKRLFDYAEDEFNIALKLEPENYDIVFEYANFLYSITKYKEADEYYEKALSINNDVIAKTLRAMNKIELNELDKAKELIDSALEEEPHHEYIQFMAGRIYFALKEYEKAKIFLIHSIEQNPDIESKNLLALTYFGLEEYKSANNIFINLLSKNSDNISLLLNSAKCYDKLGENDKALEKLYKLTEIFPEHEEAQEMIRRLS